ncbi:hypothetical protein VIGAN_08325500 [Vigna angularis var. angularis]|uniref:Uncharacterized protein n=1 Tax=Vigna angularis var. angularis TaxID=157739 RepID=A0A0S3SU25_PHAAN|nr:hypothetical protein VIGAN_08325500 [Vigna angularis var. angularis]
MKNLTCSVVLNRILPFSVILPSLFQQSSPLCILSSAGKCPAYSPCSSPSTALLFSKLRKEWCLNFQKRKEIFFFFADCRELV